MIAYKDREMYEAMYVGDFLVWESRPTIPPLVKLSGDPIFMALGGDSDLAIRAQKYRAEIVTCIKGSFHKRDYRRRCEVPRL